MNLKYCVSKITLAAVLFASCSGKPDGVEHLNMKLPENYAEDLMAHRDMQNRFFAGPSSPIDDSAKVDFKGINFYPIDTNFRVAAIFEKKYDGEKFTMPSSGSIADEYQKMGRLHFMIHDAECELDVYQNLNLKKEGNEFYFIPFYDLTSGNETYGGGRYLDIPVIISHKIIIDFNEAYQPYCAYNHNYSCPIPPLTNKLNVEVRAGERMK